MNNVVGLLCQDSFFGLAITQTNPSQQKKRRMKEERWGKKTHITLFKLPEVMMKTLINMAWLFK